MIRPKDGPYVQGALPDIVRAAAGAPPSFSELELLPQVFRAAIDVHEPCGIPL